jgi:hypothetical protein
MMLATAGVGREHSLGRQPGETPLEFAERLSLEIPGLEDEVRSLAGLYVRLAYARGSLTALFGNAEALLAAPGNYRR